MQSLSVKLCQNDVLNSGDLYPVQCLENKRDVACCNSILDAQIIHGHRDSRCNFHETQPSLARPTFKRKLLPRSRHRVLSNIFTDYATLDLAKTILTPKSCPIPIVSDIARKYSSLPPDNLRECHLSSSTTSQMTSSTLVKMVSLVLMRCSSQGKFFFLCPLHLSLLTPPIAQKDLPSAPLVAPSQRQVPSENPHVARVHEQAHQPQHAAKIQH